MQSERLLHTVVCKNLKSSFHFLIFSLKYLTKHDIVKLLTKILA